MARGSRIWGRVSKLARERCGQTMVEYALLVGILGIGTVSGITFLRDALKDTYDDTSSRASERALGIDGFASTSDFEIVNGTGTAGKPDAGDRIIVRFNGPLKVQKLCDGWIGDDTNQQYDPTIPGSRPRTGMDFIIENDAAVDRNGVPTGNDSFRIESPGNDGGYNCGGIFNFGHVDLGSPDYVTSNVEIEQSSLTWGGGGSYTLVLTLGPTSGTSQVGSATATYYPSQVLEEPGGSLIFAQPVSDTGTHF